MFQTIIDLKEDNIVALGTNYCINSFSTLSETVAKENWMISSAITPNYE